MKTTQTAIKIATAIFLSIALSGCTIHSLGSKVKVSRTFIPPDTYRYSLVETYRERPHGLEGLYRVSTEITYFDFYTTKLGWLNGNEVKLQYRPVYPGIRIDKSNAKFYFGKNKLIIKNLKGCDTIDGIGECGELRINGEHKIE